MIYIKKNKAGQFWRTNDAGNDEPLAHSQMLSSKQKVIDNIISDWKENYNGAIHPEDSIFITDTTVRKQTKWVYFTDGTKFEGFNKPVLSDE